VNAQPITDKVSLPPEGQAMKPVLHGTVSKSLFFYYGFFDDWFVSGGESEAGFFSFFFFLTAQKLCQSGLQNCR